MLIKNRERIEYLCAYIAQIVDGRFDVSPFEDVDEEERQRLNALGDRLRGISCEALGQFIVDKITDHWRGSNDVIIIDDIETNVIDDTKQDRFIVVATVYFGVQPADREQEEWADVELFLTVESRTEIQGQWVRPSEQNDAKDGVA